MIATRADLVLPVFADDEATDAIAGGECRPRKQCRRVYGLHRLQRPAAAEKHLAALVDQQEHGTFALFAEYAGVYASAAGSDTPVDAAHIVAGSVGAQFLEFDAASAPGTGVHAGGCIACRWGAQPDSCRLGAQPDQFV